MARNHTKMEHLAEIVKARKTAGETNRAIGEREILMTMQWRKTFSPFLKQNASIGTNLHHFLKRIL